MNNPLGSQFGPYDFKIREAELKEKAKKQEEERNRKK
jgi:hypothetical protein